MMADSNTLALPPRPVAARHDPPIAARGGAGARSGASAGAADGQLAHLLQDALDLRVELARGVVVAHAVVEVPVTRAARAASAWARDARIGGRGNAGREMG